MSISITLNYREKSYTAKNLEESLVTFGVSYSKAVNSDEQTVTINFSEDYAKRVLFELSRRAASFSEVQPVLDQLITDSSLLGGTRD